MEERCVVHGYSPQIRVTFSQWCPSQSDVTRQCPHWRSCTEAQIGMAKFRFGPSSNSLVCCSNEMEKFQTRHAWSKRSGPLDDGRTNEAVLRPAKKGLMAVLPEHQLLPVWKHSGSKRERFAASCCEIQRKGDPSQGVASHGKCEG